MTGRTTLRWDEADKLVEKIASDGGRTVITRDALGRATRVQAEGEDATIEWGPQGRPVRVVDKESEERFSYDAEARLVSHTRLIDGKTFETRYAFDSLGRTVKQALPSGQVLGYRYNGSQHSKPGVLAGIVREGLIDTPIVSDLNRPEERFAERGFTFGNGLSYHRQLDPQGRLTTVGSAEAGESRLSWSDDRGGQGNPKVEYRGATAGAALPSEANRPWQRKVAFTLGQLGASPTEKKQPLDALLLEATDQRFDSRGRLTQDATRRYVWDGMDRLIEVDRKGEAGAEDRPIVRYRYNVFGERIAKLVYASGSKQAKVSYFFYDGSVLTAEADESGLVTRDYVYIESRPVAMLEGRAVLAIHTDDRLAPLAVTDKDRHVVWQAQLGETGDAKVDARSTIEMPLRGSNQYFDAETGLHYNLHRYLDARSGRYISPDPMGLAAGPDLYRFALGQPHRFVDPLGLAPIATNADVANAQLADKLTYVFNKLGDTYNNELGQALKDLVSPTSIATTVGVFAIWAAAQATPVGWVADLAIAGLGYVALGQAVFDVLQAALDMATKIGTAKCLSDLDSAAAVLDRGLAAATVNVGMGVAGAAAPKMASLVRQLFKKKLPVGTPLPTVPPAPRPIPEPAPRPGVPKSTPAKVFNGIELDPRLPPPAAGYGYSPSLVKNAKTDSQAYSHWTGFQAEVSLANTVAGQGQVVVKWGDKVGARGNDIISVDPRTGAVNLWDSKYRSSDSVVKQSPTYSNKGARANAVDEAVAAVRNSDLSPEVKGQALQNLQNQDFTTNTVGAGSAKNSVQVRYCNNNPC